MIPNRPSRSAWLPQGAVVTGVTTQKWKLLTYEEGPRGGDDAAGAVQLSMAGASNGRKQEDHRRVSGPQQRLTPATCINGLHKRPVVHRCCAVDDGGHMRPARTCTKGTSVCRHAAVNEAACIAAPEMYKYVALVGLLSLG